MPTLRLLSRTRKSRLFLVVVTMIIFAILGAGCTTSDRAKESTPKLPTGKVDKIDQGDDVSAQLAEANDLRDKLVGGGIDCEGEAEPPDLAPGDIEFGVAAQLFCTVDDAEVQIVVYRSPSAKKSGVSRLTFLACASRVPLEYVEGATWVVGSMVEGTSETDATMVKRVATALDAPLKAASC